MSMRPGSYKPGVRSAQAATTFHFVGFLSLVLAASASTAQAQDSAAASLPRWSVEVKAGRFKPDVPAWETYYGEDSTRAFAVAIGRKLGRQVELGAELLYGSDRGMGSLPLNDRLGGEVLYEFAPVHAYILARGVLSERQWLVPFIGAGIGQLYYRQHVSGGSSSEGNTSYHTARAGVQLLLDRISPNSATNLRRGYGIEHTYLILDFQRSSAEIDGTPWDLGGDTWLAGLLFEY